MSVLIFISTVLSCFGADAKPQEEEVITLPEKDDLRHHVSCAWSISAWELRLLLVSVSLRGWADCTHWHVHSTHSQSASMLIALGWCHTSHRFWMSLRSRWCWCPARIFSAHLSHPVTSGDYLQLADHFLPQVHTSFFSGTLGACSIAGRGHMGMWRVKSPRGNSQPMRRKVND